MKTQNSVLTADIKPMNQNQKMILNNKLLKILLQVTLIKTKNNLINQFQKIKQHL
jgi:hypothetical protein